MVIVMGFVDKLGQYPETSKLDPLLSDVSIFNLSLISPHLYNVIISSLGRDKRETIKSKDLLNNRIGLKVGIYWMVYRVFHSKVVSLVSLSFCLHLKSK